MTSRLLLLVFSMAICCGCKPRLSDTRDLKIAGGEVVSIGVDPIQADRQLKVSASSPDVPIDVHLFLKDHEEAIERMLTLGKPPENVLASIEGSNQISLNVPIPAGKEAIIRLQSASAQAANVHLELSD